MPLNITLARFTIHREVTKMFFWSRATMKFGEVFPFSRLHDAQIIHNPLVEHVALNAKKCRDYALKVSQRIRMLRTHGTVDGGVCFL